MKFSHLVTGLVTIAAALTYLLLHYQVLPRTLLLAILVPLGGLGLVYYQEELSSVARGGDDDTVAHPEKLEAITYINDQLQENGYTFYFDPDQPEKIHYAAKDYELLQNEGVMVGLVGRAVRYDDKTEFTTRVIWDWTRDFARKVDGETYDGDTRTNPFAEYDPAIVRHSVQTVQKQHRRRGNTIYIGSNPNTPSAEAPETGEADDRRT